MIDSSLSTTPAKEMYEFEPEAKPEPAPKKDKETAGNVKKMRGDLAKFLKITV
jgi:hypothetical protein